MEAARIEFIVVAYEAVDIQSVAVCSYGHFCLAVLYCSFCVGHKQRGHALGHSSFADAVERNLRRSKCIGQSAVGRTHAELVVVGGQRFEIDCDSFARSCFTAVICYGFAVALYVPAEGYCFFGTVGIVGIDGESERLVAVGHAWNVGRECVGLAGDKVFRSRSGLADFGCRGNVGGECREGHVVVILCREHLCRDNSVEISYAVGIAAYRTDIGLRYEPTPARSSGHAQIDLRIAHGHARVGAHAAFDSYESGHGSVAFD